MTTKKVLAFDIAQQTGYAYRNGGNKITTGSFKKQDYIEWYKELQRVIYKVEPTHIVYEHVYHSVSRKSAESWCVRMGYLLLAAYGRDVPVTSYGPTEWQKILLGSLPRKKAGDTKEKDFVKKCVANRVSDVYNGWKNFDESDAAGILLAYEIDNGE